jgi:hypothetical protein
VCPHFFEIFSFDFIEFSMKKFFDNSYIVCLNILKSPWCTPAHQGLSHGMKSVKNGNLVWVGDLNMTKKNKQTTFLSGILFNAQPHIYRKSLTIYFWVCFFGGFKS